MKPFNYDSWADCLRDSEVPDYLIETREDIAGSKIEWIISTCRDCNETAAEPLWSVIKNGILCVTCRQGQGRLV